MAASNGAKRQEPIHRTEEVSRHDWLERGTEMVLAVLMGAVSLATAWSGYQSARWGGVQSVKFSQAGAFRSESVRASTAAGQLAQIDIGKFTR